jgi:hypothetical protein
LDIASRQGQPALQRAGAAIRQVVLGDATKLAASKDESVENTAADCGKPDFGIVFHACIFVIISTTCLSDRTRGFLNFSNASWASRARAFASAVSFRNWSAWTTKEATRSADSVRSFSQYASLTPAIQTIRTVETTPTTKLPIKNQLATSAIWLAVGNDGHIRLPLWFPIGAIVIVVLAGFGGLFVLLRRGSS